MKNLKKVLSLVLALAMAMSLMTAAFAADASKLGDYNKVSHNEAVDVVAAVGVMVGDANGNYNPTDVLDRASAAKIIAYLTLGEETAEDLEASGKMFTDVSASHWAAKYIEYCATKGYIAGNGAGQFYPNVKLTGIDFAKMLLCALGYDATTEGLTGEGYAINTSALASKQDQKIFKNTDGKASAQLTRENAAEMILNTLQNTTKNFNKGTTTTVNGVTVTTGGSYGTDGKLLYKELYGTDLVLDDTTGDEFGRPANTWTYAGDKIGTYVQKADFTFTTAMTEKEIFAAVGAAGIQGSSDKYIVMDYIYENGVLKNEAKEVTGHKGQYEAKTNDGSFEHTVIIAKNTKDNTAGFGNGVTVELFENDTNHYTMVAIPQFIGTIGSVTKADADKGIDRSVTVTGAGSFDTENFEKGDIVLYTTGNNGIASMTEAKTISGKVTKISNGEIYTIDGNTYELSQNNNITTALRVGDKGTWYVDTFGNIIDTKESDSEDVYYGYLLAYGRNSANDADLFGNGAEDNGEKVKFVNASGEKVVLDCAYDTDKDGNVTTWVAPDAWETYGSNVLFAYELNSKGEISKITVASETWTTNEQTITKGNAVMTKSALALTRDTVFFYVDTTNEEYAVYTGYKNVPTKTGNLVARIHDGGEMIALVLSVSDVNATSDKQYVYFAGDDVDVETTEDDTIYTYTNVYVDGVKTTLVNDSALTFTVGHIYDYTTDNDGYATLGSTNIDATTDGTEITNIQATYFKAGSMIYTDDDTVYYEVDQDNKTISVVEGLPELSKKDAYDVMLLWNDKGTDSDTGADLVVFYTK